MINKHSSKIKFLIFIIIFNVSLSYANTWDDFDQFDQFDKQDKEMLNQLLDKAERCIKNWNFSCAENALSKAEKYITSKKDKQKINRMYSYLEEERERKRREEEERRRLAQERAMRNFSLAKCQALKQYCEGFCEYKSNEGSGFFSSSDKEKCYSYCSFGEESCKQNDMIDARNYICSGICQGLDESDGFFIFESSTFDKCHIKCTIELENKGW